MKIKVLNSSPYYAQANGQAESSNKTLLKVIKKKIDEFPRKWHEVLSEALWAHRTSKHGVCAGGCVAHRGQPAELPGHQAGLVVCERLHREDDG
jgi:hypothetical protein